MTSPIQANNKKRRNDSVLLGGFFLNNTKTPNFTFLGVKLGAYFAICWFSAFIAEREAPELTPKHRNLRGKDYFNSKNMDKNDK